MIRANSSAYEIGDSLANICIFNPVFRRGGSDLVMMNIIESLQQDHNVSILSFGKVDIAGLNEYFGTAVKDIDEVETGVVLSNIPPLMEGLKRVTGSWFGSFHVAVTSKRIETIVSNYDLVVSSGELPIDHPKIQYVHYPRYYTHEVDSRIAETVYQKLSNFIGRFGKPNINDGDLITNSCWTKSITDSIYSSNCEVVYPPITVEDFEQIDWEDQEEGIVSIGRIDRSKRISDIIEIVDQLVDNGHEIHHHIVGPASDDKYAKRINKMVATRPYVHLEGEVSRQRMIDLINSHKYGLHGMRNEHFGIAIAEMLAGKTIPMVPNGGGQTEIVKEMDSLTYDNQGQAVKNFERIINNTDMQLNLLRDLSDVEARFGKERFHKEFRNIVSKKLSR